jgi:hypothetical protein
MAFISSRAVNFSPKISFDEPELFIRSHPVPQRQV